MKKAVVVVFAAALALASCVIASAQEPTAPPGGQQGRPRGFGGGGGQGRFQMPQFADLDKDKDKKISRSEWGSLPAQLFDRYDENHDGFIDEDEWNRARSRMAGGGMRFGEMLLKVLDADKDGKVSREEFAKIVALFDLLDQDKNGELSQEELNGFGRALNEAQLKPTGGVNTASAFDKLDKDHDGKITPEEANNPALFKSLDLNKDGVVTREEFEKAVKQLAERSKAQPNTPAQPTKNP